jgi:hypothetical protein
MRAMRVPSFSSKLRTSMRTEALSRFDFSRLGERRP